MINYLYIFLSVLLGFSLLTILLPFFYLWMLCLICSIGIEELKRKKIRKAKDPPTAIFSNNEADPIWQRLQEENKNCLECKNFINNQYLHCAINPSYKDIYGECWDWEERGD